MPKRGAELNPTAKFQQSQRGSFGSREPVPQPAEDVSKAPEDTSSGGREAFGAGATADDGGHESKM